MKKLFLSLLVLSLSVPAFADTHVADNCSSAAVSAAITAATAGDNVTIPAGTCDWSGGGLSVAKSIAIIGAGSGCPSACDDATTLQIGAQTAFSFSGNTDNWRVSGITFDGAANSSGAIYLNGGGATAQTGWRIDHNHFSNNTGRSITVGASASVSGYGADYPGLIDSNYFSATNQNKVVQLYGGSLTTHGDWDNTLELGGSDFLFFENNKAVFSDQTVGTSGFDSDTGGRFVFRHNDVTNFWISAHGREQSILPSVLWKSTHGWEIYGNAFSGGSVDFLIYLRGGTGAIWGNSIAYTSVSADPINYYYERGDDDRTGGCLTADGCTGSGAYDGNQVGEYGYVCYQQIGATGAAGITSMPVYQWGNTFNGSSDESTFTSVQYDTACNIDNNSIQHVQIARDIILNGSTPKPGYTKYTCPHPLTGLSEGCDSGTAGIAGYDTGGGADAVPNNFSFTDITEANPSTVTTTSPCITVAGIDAGQTPAITISGTGCTYNVDGAAYTANAGTVGLDNVVCLRGTSSGSYSTTYPSCTLTIGGVSNTGAPWTVRTLDAVSDPVAPRMRAGSMSGGWR